LENYKGITMALRLSVQKTKQTSTRKLKFLPRVGLTLDLAGRQFTFKQAPFLESVVNMRKKKFNLENLRAISNQILDEITLERKRRPTAKRKTTKKS